MTRSSIRRGSVRTATARSSTRSRCSWTTRCSSARRAATGAYAAIVATAGNRFWSSIVWCIVRKRQTWPHRPETCWAVSDGARAWTPARTASMSSAASPAPSPAPSRRASAARVSVSSWWRKWSWTIRRWSPTARWAGSSSTEPATRGRVASSMGGTRPSLRPPPRDRAPTRAAKLTCRGDTASPRALTRFGDWPPTACGIGSHACTAAREGAMNTASKLLIASTTSVVLATAAASSGSGAVQTVTTKAHPGHSAHSVTPKDPQAKKYVKGVSVPEITDHQVALQRIASLNNDTREVFSSGYRESLDYVVSTLKEAGYQPQVTQFNFPVWSESQPPVLNQVTPTPKTYVPGDAEDSDLPTADFITMANSPTVALTNAPVFPVGGIVDPPTGGSTSGCAEGDYAGVAGKVALVQRGTCAFVTKWSLAQAAGATGVIIYNEGNTPARQNPIFVDNQPDPPATIAAVITSYTLGNELLQASKLGQNPTVDFKVYGTFTDRFLPQVIAETRGGDPNHVVVVGAHLDSVPAGPGINDDGSGTATLLAQAEEVADGHYKLRNKIRFAWWGAEENGLVGSSYYAENLSQAEVDKVDVMLDYDMLASANYIRGVYDGDGDDTEDGSETSESPESGKVEAVFEDWFRAQGQPVVKGAFDGRSDYVGFTLRGIPSGGIYAGAEGVKTAEEEQIFGGAAGSWYDPCYHQICDNLSTVFTGVMPLSAEGLGGATDAEKRAARRKMAGGSIKSLRELSAAAAYAVYHFADSK